MARGETTFVWGDGEHTFALPIGQIEELQDKTGVGPYALLRRLQDGTWLQNDLRHTIRLGLIGGGLVTPVGAHKLMVRYVDERPLLESVTPATVVLLAALITPEGEDAAPGGEAATEEPETESPSPTSTVSEPQ